MYPICGEKAFTDFKEWNDIWDLHFNMITQVAVWGMDGKEAGRECWRNIPEAFTVVQGGDELGW